MKIILALIFSFFIITKSGSNLPVCNIQTAKQALPPRIFAEQTIDGQNQQILTTRFFHNKVGILGSEFARCYFNVIDPNFIYQTVGIFGLIFQAYFAYKILLYIRSQNTVESDSTDECSEYILPRTNCVLLAHVNLKDNTCLAGRQAEAFQASEVYKKWFITTALLLVPILPFFNVSPTPVIYSYKLFAIIGLVLLISKVNLKPKKAK